jgi:hypothetical protein
MALAWTTDTPYPAGVPRDTGSCRNRVRKVTLPPSIDQLQQQVGSSLGWVRLADELEAMLGACGPRPSKR